MAQIMIDICKFVTPLRNYDFPYLFGPTDLPSKFRQMVILTASMPIKTKYNSPSA
jgi:hypothetical protein